MTTSTRPQPAVPPHERRSKICTLAEAACAVPDGATLGLGGWTFYNTPMALVREIVRAGTRDLRLVAAPGAIGPDLLIAGGCLREIATPFLTMEQFGLAPAFAAAAAAGTLRIAEIDGPALAAALRSGADDLPYGLVHDLGTDLPTVNPAWFRPYPDPFDTGARLLAVPAVIPDVALVHAQRADAYGNLQFLGATFFDQLVVRAARRVIATVDELVDTEEIRADPRLTRVPGYLVTDVVPIERGAAPCGSHGLYPPDLDHLAEYTRLARTEVGRAEYLDRYVHTDAAV
ncbi:CoA-transferase [Pseudonocardia sp. NPDC049154]|uniref:CoA transferase subunit A n=1 Tax=Pseudonocardia sp. NPDC049154 TaxID=3155501 RepID=UPI0033F4D337